MRAVVLRRFGGPEALRLEEVPEPEPGPNEIRIAVSAEADLISAAAIPLAAGTALEVLERLATPHGGTILVLGASGGVGLFLVQLATHHGLRVIAVGGPDSHDRMHEAGGPHVSTTAPRTSHRGP